MKDTKATGQNIDAYCRKCKQGTDHTIMVMDAENAEKVSKVRCKACGSTHKFRCPVEVAAIRKPPVKSAAAEAATAESVWEAGLAAATGKEQDYDQASKYRIGDIVNHHAFGKGVVLNIYVNKCSMLFKDGEKLMVSTNQSR